LSDRASRIAKTRLEKPEHVRHVIKISMPSAGAPLTRSGGPLWGRRANKLSYPDDNIFDRQALRVIGRDGCLRHGRRCCLPRRMLVEG
jgi:hypothetical protein